MPLVAVTYVKGRPGATTTALGLAAVAPAQLRPVVIETDPAGGDLMRRLNLAATPSLVDLAAAARGATHAEGAFTAGQQTAVIGKVEVPVVVAPAGGAQTRAALPELTGAGRAVLTPKQLVIADCGRLVPDSAAWPLLRLADVVVVMARARPDELAHVQEALGALVDVGAGRLVVLLAAGGLYPAADVAEVLSRYVAEELARDPASLVVLGPLPTDRKAAAVLGGDLVAGRRWRRLPLMRAYTGVLDDLAPHLRVASTEPDVSEEAAR